MQQSPSGDGSDLLAAIVDACHAAIDKALAAPQEALGLAEGLSGTLATLRLVAGEVAKGDGGIPAVTQNAESLVRDALAGVLSHAADADGARAAIASVGAVLPRAPSSSSESAPAYDVEVGGTSPGRMPTFGEVSQSYIDMWIASDGEDHKDVNYLRLRRRTFTDIFGDGPVDRYRPIDLQTYVSEMQFWPANQTKRGEFSGLDTKEILATEAISELMESAGIPKSAPRWLKMVAEAEAGGHVEGTVSRSPFARLGGDRRRCIVPSGGRTVRHRRRQRHPMTYAGATSGRCTTESARWGSPIGSARSPCRSDPQRGRRGAGHHPRRATAAPRRTGRDGCGLVALALLRAASDFAEKKTAHAAEQDRPDILKRRRAWFDGQIDLDPNRLVFIDETWASTNMARKLGRAPKGERLRVGVPHGHWKTTTFVAG